MWDWKEYEDYIYSSHMRSHKLTQFFRSMNLNVKVYNDGLKQTNQNENVRSWEWY